MTSKAFLLQLILLTATVPTAFSQTQGDAYRKFNNFLQSSGNDDSIVEFKKGRDFIESGKWRDAERVFANFSERFPTNKNLDAALYWQAVAARKLNNFAKAESLCDRMLAEFPSSNWTRDAKALKMELAPFVGNIDLVSSQLEAAVAEATAQIMLDIPDDVVDLQGAPAHPLAFNGKMSEQDELKSIALQSLIRSNPEKALTYISSILGKDSKASPALKNHALFLLGQLPGDKSASVLMDVARNDSNAFTRRSALISLGSSSDPRVIDFLVEQASRPDDSEAAMAAIRALARQRNDRAREAILRLARSGATPGARKTAIQSFTSRMDDAGADQLLSIFNGEKDPAVQAQIISVLGRSKSPAIEARLSELVRNGANDEVRSAAVTAVARRGNDAAVEELVKAYRQEQSQKVKSSIISALGRMAGGWSDYYYTFGEFNNRFMSDAFAEARVNLQGAAAAASEARRAARSAEDAAALAPEAARPARPSVPRPPTPEGAAATSPRPASRNMYVNVDGAGERKPNDKAFKALLSLFDSESNEKLKLQLLSSFGRTDNKEGLKKLISVAKSDSSVEVRKQAASIIGRSKDPEAIKFMEDLLK